MCHSDGMRKCVDFGSMYGGNYKNRIESDSFRRFNPNFFIMTLIHCAEITEISHIHLNVTLIGLRQTLPTTDVHSSLQCCTLVVAMKSPFIFLTSRQSSLPMTSEQRTIYES